jgi:hypothetical protein
MLDGREMSMNQHLGVVAACWILTGSSVFVGAASAECPQDVEDGFTCLFDGKTLEGWQGSVNGYSAQDGLLICEKKGGGHLLAKKEYSDFVFRFEFKLEPGGNNGVAVRAPMGGRISRTGIEIQILDDTSPRYKKLKPYQFHGSVYGLAPAKRGFLKPVGEWNSQEVLCDGSRIRVTLNGTVIVETNLSTIKKPMDGYEHPGRHRKSGFVGFIGHNSRIEFRNIRIKDLSNKPTD